MKKVMSTSLEMMLISVAFILCDYPTEFLKQQVDLFFAWTDLLHQGAHYPEGA